MRQLAEEGMTMLVVTHEMGFARNVSSKTVFMENGVVVEQAPSHEFFANPKEERTREFFAEDRSHRVRFNQLPQSASQTAPPGWGLWQKTRKSPKPERVWRSVSFA